MRAAGRWHACVGVCVACVWCMSVACVLWVCRGCAVGGVVGVKVSGGMPPLGAWCRVVISERVLGVLGWWAVSAR